MKDTHISEFTAKRGSGLHIRVTTTRHGHRISVDGGRLYYSDFENKKACLREARRIRDQILIDLDLSPAPGAAMPSVADLFDQSFDVMPVALNTRRNKEYTFRHGIGDLAEKRIDKLTLSEIQLSVNRYALERTQGPVKSLVALWRRIYQTALFLQLPVLDLSQMIRIPKSRIPAKAFNKETDLDTFHRFLDALEDSKSYYAPILRDVCLVMYYTGIRCQEALGLMVTDFDPEAAMLRIERSCGSTASQTCQIVPLKTAQSRRVLPVVPDLFPILERLCSQAETELLFVDPEDKPINVRRISMVAAKIAEKHGLRFNMYALRHLFAADMFRQGVNPKIIQGLMGHASADMSAYYAFTTEDERNEAMLHRKPS